MNAIIYYFSATGNSLTAAKDLALELGNAKLIPITKASTAEGAESYDAVGIVYPVYMFALPLIVAEFLKTIKIKQGAYVFCVATLGGMPGRPHSLSREILKKRGVDLAAGFSVKMPGNYIVLYGAKPKETQQKLFEKEKARIKDIALYVREGKRGTFEEYPFLINLTLYKLLYKKGSSKIPLLGKNFWATDSCNKCGTCAKVCPVANIEMRDGRPAWLDHCQHCMACLQWCPVEAIEYKKVSVGRKRYRNPDITAQDIMQQNNDG